MEKALNESKAKFQEELKSQFAEIKSNLEKEVKESFEKQLNEKLEGFKELTSKEELKAAQEEMQKQFDELATNMNKPSTKQFGNSFMDQLEKALTEALPTLKEMKGSEEHKGKELVLNIKAPVTMTTGAVGNASGVTTPDSYVYQQVTDYATDVRADAYIVNFMDNGSTDRASLPYMDKVPNEGTMAVTAEGELKPLISFSFELRYSQADKIAGRVKVSEEALDDIPGLMSIIQNELRYEHDQAQQDWIFTKINAVAGAFVAGDLAASTDAPSNYDAVRAAIYAVKIQSKGKYIPNAVLVPSADLYAMGATKDQNDNYVMPAFVLPDGSRVSGVQVVEVNEDGTVPAGSFIVGDFRKLKRRVYKSFTVRMGQGIVGSATAADIASDFEKNMYTIIGESRQHLWIYENEKIAFIKSTFAAVKTAIETPAV